MQTSAQWRRSDSTPCARGHGMGRFGGDLQKINLPRWWIWPSTTRWSMSAKESAFWNRNRRDRDAAQNVLNAAMPSCAGERLPTTSSVYRWHCICQWSTGVPGPRPPNKDEGCWQDRPPPLIPWSALTLLTMITYSACLAGASAAASRRSRHAWPPVSMPILEVIGSAGSEGNTATPDRCRLSRRCQKKKGKSVEFCWRRPPADRLWRGLPRHIANM